MFAKGHKPQTASYASGGAVLGRVRDFMKEPDSFRDGSGKNDESWGKGSGDKLTPKDKSLKAVKPKS